MSDEVEDSVPVGAARSKGGEIEVHELLRALIDEAVRSRLRHRALIAVLESSAALKLADYLAAYQIEEERNFEPLLDMLLLAPEGFLDRHAAWLDSEQNRFGFAPAALHRLSLSKTPSPDSQPEVSKPASRKATKRKRT